MLLCAAAPAVALAAGIEHPDNGAVSIGRGGAWAANPDGGLAIQYNPAGLTQQSGLRLTVESKLVDQKIAFQPQGSSETIEDGASPFFAPAGAISYGLGPVGALSSLTLAVGGLGPSAVGITEYPKDGPQRYALVDTDYFIAYLSGAVAASYESLVSVGVTAQLVKGVAKFSKAAWTGNGDPMDPRFMSVATIDVESGFIPTYVAGLTLTPMEGLAIGLSYRPTIEFVGTGTLTTELPAVAQQFDINQQGNEAELRLKFPDVVRAGLAYAISSELAAEMDFVYERWSVLESIDIVPQGIMINNPRTGVTKPLQPIILEKDFRDAWSLRFGGDYQLLAERLTARLGYLYETSAIPRKSTSIDFANYGRHAVSIGASVALFGAWLDLGYMRSFIPERTVRNSNVVQTVSPCTNNSVCEPPPGAVVGNGRYNAHQQLFAVSLRVAADDVKSDL